jgi:hypothetical protein
MKIKFLIILAIACSFIACENQEKEFDDFGSTSVYFPFQTPIRTLIQGKYDLGFNDNDNKGIFEIGVVMSGVYNNDKERKVSFEFAPDLIDLDEIRTTNSTIIADSINVKLLPSSYYTIEQESPVTIPKGEISGRIPIQLQDAFFDDPLSFAGEGEVHYVLPLRITDFDENLDSLLVGVANPDIPNPVKIIDEHWNPTPKDYTLFGIKFINKYSGTYLRRGEDKAVGTSEVVKVTTATGATETETTNVDGSTVYRNEFVVRDEVTSVTTAGRNKAISTNLVRRPGIPSNLNVSLLLTFNNNEEITITNADEDSDIVITGSGKYVEDADEWGRKTRDVIYLEYEYRDQQVDVEQEIVFGSVRSETTTTVDLLHTVKDTLVIRDRAVVFEEFTVNLEKSGN